MSDDFRMFEFKVRRCSRTRAHAATECPYTHPGEKARRRDPRRFHYSGSACPDFRKGSASQGTRASWRTACSSAGCTQADTAQLCKDGALRPKGVLLAHAPNQLRPPTDAFATSSLGWRTSSTRRSPRRSRRGRPVTRRWRAPTDASAHPPAPFANIRDPPRIHRGVRAFPAAPATRGALVLVTVTQRKASASSARRFRGHASLDLSDR